MIDLTTLTDSQLDTLRTEITTERDRRADLARIPTEISELRERYTLIGGDLAALDSDDE